ncbi:hypothetical protein [Sorangium sp. So ce1335]|uniref:hypothetical protein n=1 Tax=Sorangium sp. So ce1335 TaxID=3133335 RepID=UPI003F612B95
MASESGRNPTLHFWDVPAAILGLAVAGALSRIPLLEGFGLLWIGAPAAFVALRRVALPQLTPAATVPRPTLSFWQRLGAYCCLIVGGVITLLSGIVFYINATHATRAEFSWKLLLPLAIGGAIAAVGVRKLT